MGATRDQNPPSGSFHKEVPARLAGLIVRLVESERVATGEGYRPPPATLTNI